MKNILPGDNLFTLINGAIKNAESIDELYNELNDLFTQLTPSVGVSKQYKYALNNMVIGLEILKR